MARKSMKSLGNPSICIAYMRVSKEEQHLGPEAQRKQIELWAERQETTVVAWHIDQGITGAAGIDQRPGLAAALNDIRAHQAGWLVVAKRDRLARDVYLTGAVDKVIRASGAKLASADGAPLGDEPAEVMQRQIGDVFAQYERAIIAMRTKAALAVKRARGERIGNIPYGWRPTPDGAHHEPRTCHQDCTGCLRITRCPNEQTIIGAARALRARGITLRGIASLLDLEGFKTRKGTAFTHMQVTKMLDEPAPEVNKAAAPPSDVEMSTQAERVADALRRMRV
jgi:DNA invertase Pin-like site-specific DNA recombinase